MNNTLTPILAACLVAQANNTNWSSPQSIALHTGSALIIAAVTLFSTLKPDNSYQQHSLVTHEISAKISEITDLNPVTLRIHRSSYDNRKFVHRPALSVLVRHLQNKEHTLIVGPPFSGKTRLVIEALKNINQAQNLWYPLDDNAILQSLKDGFDPPRGSIVFLDDIQRFLRNNSITLDRIRCWNNAEYTIVATISPAERSSLTKENDLVLSSMNRIDLSSRLSEDELENLIDSPYQLALDSIRQYGLGPTLAGAEKALDRFRDGKTLNPRGWSIVANAVDLRRCNVGTATREELISLAKKFPHENLALHNREEFPGWKSAWNWAVAQPDGSVPLIQEASRNQWESLSTIVDKADWSTPVDFKDFLNYLRESRLHQSRLSRKRGPKSLNSPTHRRERVFPYFISVLIFLTANSILFFWQQSMLTDVHYSYRPSDPPQVSMEATRTPTPILGADTSIPQSRSVTLEDIFLPPNSASSGIYNITGMQEQEGIGVTITPHTQPETLELRLGNRYKKLTFTAGQDSHSENSDMLLHIEIRKNGVRDTAYTIPFGEAKEISIDVKDVNSLSITLDARYPDGTETNRVKTGNTTAVLQNMRLE